MTAPGRRPSRRALDGAQLAAELADDSPEIPAEPAKEEAGQVVLTKEELQAMLDQARNEAVAAVKAIEDDVEVVRGEVDPSNPNAVTVHFLDDGHTVLGRVWYRGEEATVLRGSEEWNTDAKYWIELSEHDQVRKYGKRIFAPGPWPYSGYDVEDPELNESERELLKRANSRRAISGGKARSRSPKNSMVVGG